MAGGQESMSRAPHATYLRNGIKFGNCNLVDTLIDDGLTDAFYNIHMAITGKMKILQLDYNFSIIKIKILYECYYIFLLFTFLTAENIAEKYSISREAQDYYASKSQQKAETAINAGYFVEEIIPVTIAGKKESIVISKDEFPKFGTTAEKLAKLRPAFKPVCKYYFL